MVFVHPAQHKGWREAEERGLTHGEMALSCERTSNSSLISSKGVWKQLLAGELCSRAGAERALVPGKWDFLREGDKGRSRASFAVSQEKGRISASLVLTAVLLRE